MTLEVSFCGKILHGIGEDTDTTIKLRKAEQDGKIIVNRFKNCIILSKNIDENSVYGHFTFESFDRSTVRAIQNMILKYADKNIMVKTSCPKMERLVVKFGFIAKSEAVNGEQTLWLDRR